MDMTACTETLRTKVGDDCGLNATLKFDCGDDGVLVIDGRSVPNGVHNNKVETDCTITITQANLAALLNGELDPTTGFMMGKFQVEHSDQPSVTPCAKV